MIYWELIFAFVMAGHKMWFRGHSIFNISDILPDYIIDIQCRNIRNDPCWKYEGSSRGSSILLNHLWFVNYEIMLQYDNILDGNIGIVWKQYRHPIRQTCHAISDYLLLQIHFSDAWFKFKQKFWSCQILSPLTGFLISENQGRGQSNYPRSNRGWELSMDGLLDGYISDGPILHSKVNGPESKRTVRESSTGRSK